MANTETSNSIDLSQGLTATSNSNLQIYVLCNDVSELNPDYVRMFSQPNSGFSEVIFSGIQFPDMDWINYFIKFMNRSQAIELYNHYKIWLLSMEKNQPMVILYNRSYPTQPDHVMMQLIKAGQLIHDLDILFYGKYLDLCEEYRYDRSVIINQGTLQSGEAGFKFPLYRTVSPFGVYAYMIYPSGARKLIDEISYNPGTTEVLVNRLIEKGILKADTYHPSIIRLNDPIDINVRYECREPNNQKSLLTWGNVVWYVLIFILLGLLVGILIYFIISNVTYQGPGRSQTKTPTALESTLAPPPVQSEIQQSAPNSEVRVGSIRSPTQAAVVTPLPSS